MAWAGRRVLVVAIAVTSALLVQAIGVVAAEPGHASESAEVTCDQDPTGYQCWTEETNACAESHPFETSPRRYVSCIASETRWWLTGVVCPAGGPCSEVLTLVDERCDASGVCEFVYEEVVPELAEILQPVLDRLPD